MALAFPFPRSWMLLPGPWQDLRQLSLVLQNKEVTMDGEKRNEHKSEDVQVVLFTIELHDGGWK